MSYLAKHRALSGVLVSLISGLCCCPTAQAQWVELYPNLIGTGPYNNLGAMAAAGGIAWAGMYELYKSTDQGVSWNPVALSLGGNYINDISFYDDSTGVVSTIGSGLYLTTNQGATWQNEFPGDNIFAARFAGSAKDIVVGDASTHNFDFTTDGGITWTSVAANIDPKDFYSPSPGNVIAFVESSASSYIANTTDYGQTWTTQPGIMEADAHSFAAMPCEGNIIFGINEEGGNYTQDNRLAEIYLSRDDGNSFTSIEQYSLAYLAGCALITPAVVYVPTRTNGILESTDTGVTWNTANGPAFAIDCRDLVAVNDTLLLLADQNGSIWSTVDTRSKGIPASAELIASPSSVRFANPIPVCSAPASTVIYIKRGCMLPSIKSVSFTGSSEDSAFFSIQTGEPNDSIVVFFAPNAARNYAANIQIVTSDGHIISVPVTGTGSTTGTVQLFSASEESTDTIGGTISLSLLAQPSIPGGIISMSIGFDTSTLVYIGTHIPGESIDRTTSTGAGTARIQLAANNTHGDTVCISDFLIYPEGDSCTTVLFDPITVSDTMGSNCTFSSAPISAQVCTPANCGTPLLSQIVRYGEFSTLRIIPDPAYSTVSIAADSELGTAAISIFDAEGVERITTQSMIGPKQSPIIPLGDLPSGLYFIQVRGGGIFTFTPVHAHSIGTLVTPRTNSISYPTGTWR